MLGTSHTHKKNDFTILWCLRAPSANAACECYCGKHSIGSANTSSTTHKQMPPYARISFRWRVVDGTFVYIIIYAILRFVFNIWIRHDFVYRFRSLVLTTFWFCDSVFRVPFEPDFLLFAFVLAWNCDAVGRCTIRTKKKRTQNGSETGSKCLSLINFALGMARFLHWSCTRVPT